MGKCRCERMDERMRISVLLFAGLGIFNFILAAIFREHYFQYIGIGIGFMALAFLVEIIESLNRDG